MNIKLFIIVTILFLIVSAVCLYLQNKHKNKIIDFKKPKKSLNVILKIIVVFHVIFVSLSIWSIVSLMLSDSIDFSITRYIFSHFICLLMSIIFLYLIFKRKAILFITMTLFNIASYFIMFLYYFIEPKMYFCVPGVLQYFLIDIVLTLYFIKSKRIAEILTK